MLNYISAEFYKLRRKKGLYVGMALLLALEGLLFVPGFWVVREDEMALACLAFLVLALTVGVFIAPILASLTFDDQHGNGTLKNEIVYGIPRSRVYLGKLAAAMLVGTLCAAAAIVWYLLLLALNGAELASVPATLWWPLWGSIFVAWTVWLSTLAVAFFLLSALKSAAAAMIVAYLLTLIGMPTALIGGTEASSPRWFALLCRHFYTFPMGGNLLVFQGGESWDLTVPSYWLTAVGVCLLWVAGATALGLFLLDRREIK